MPVSRDHAIRLVQLRLDVINTLHLYNMIDREEAKTPIDAMRHQVLFTASSLKTAQVVMEIVNELLDEAGF